MNFPEQRLFFALWPDAEFRRRLQRVARRLPVHNGRLTHPLDWHITLFFLGNVDESRTACVKQAAASVGGAPFQLTIDQIGFWRRPRILWCAPLRVPDSLVRLVESLSQRLEMCGFKPESREYKPHITLARKSLPVEAQRLDPSLVWPVREFVLVASHSGGRPPRYQVIARWSLAQGVSD